MRRPVGYSLLLYHRRNEDILE